MSEQGQRRLTTGPFYEDFSVGHRLTHGGRTITRTDNTWFTLLTCNNNPIHFDNRYASETEYGQLVVNSAFTLALATGLTVNELSRNAVNLGWDHVRLSNPLFPGDTLWCETEILECRLSDSRPNMGIIRARTTGRNQDGVEIITFERSILIPRRAQGEPV
jgi:acyl dehydratase